MTEPQRQVVLAALDRFYTPVEHADLAAYARTFSPEIGELPPCDEVVDTEAVRWRAGSSAPPWFCPAFAWPGGLTDPEYLTQSDWAVDVRILIGDRDQVRHLWLVRVFSELLIEALYHGLDSPAPLLERLRRHGDHIVGDVPDLSSAYRSGSDEEVSADDLEELRERVEDAYQEFADDWRSAGRHFARRLDGLSDGARLFGPSAAR